MLSAIAVPFDSVWLVVPIGGLGRNMKPSCCWVRPISVATWALIWSVVQVGFWTVTQRVAFGWRLIGGLAKEEPLMATSVRVTRCDIVLASPFWEFFW